MATTLEQTQTNNTKHKTRSLYSVERKELSPQEIEDVKQAFPDVNPGFVPNGNRILVQLRTPVEKTKGGIILTDNMQAQQLYDEQIGRVVSIGQAAFRNPSNMEQWAEGEWFAVGDYVRVPKFGGDKTYTVYPDKDDPSQQNKTLFVVFRDYDIIGTIFGNPLDIKGTL